MCNYLPFINCNTFSLNVTEQIIAIPRFILTLSARQVPHMEQNHLILRDHLIFWGSCFIGPKLSICCFFLDFFVILLLFCFLHGIMVLSVSFRLIKSWLLQWYLPPIFFSISYLSEQVKSPMPTPTINGKKRWI